MLNANTLSALLATVIVLLVAARVVGARRRVVAPVVPDEEFVRRRTLIAWEVRCLAVAVAGPVAAGIYFGYVPTDYTLPMLLFVAADFLAAGLIAPAGVHQHD